MLESFGSNSNGMCIHVVLWICTNDASESVNSIVYPQKAGGMFHPLSLVPIYQTA